LSLINLSNSIFCNFTIHPIFILPGFFPPFYKKISKFYFIKLSKKITKFKFLSDVLIYQIWSHCLSCDWLILITIYISRRFSVKAEQESWRHNLFLTSQYLLCICSEDCFAFSSTPEDVWFRACITIFTSFSLWTKLRQLHCTVLFCAVPYRTVPYRTVPYRTVLSQVWFH
jgi:hypothetical protein